MKWESSAGTSVIEMMAMPIMAKLLVNASGWKVLPSCPVRAKTGMKDIRMIMTEKKIGRPTVRQAGITISRVSPVIRLSAEMRRQMMRGVLHHHDRLVHQDADRDGDARQRHDVRRDAEVPHQDEATRARPAAA